MIPAHGLQLFAPFWTLTRTVCARPLFTEGLCARAVALFWSPPLAGHPGFTCAFRQGSRRASRVHFLKPDDNTISS